MLFNLEDVENRPISLHLSLLAYIEVVCVHSYNLVDLACMMSIRLAHVWVAHAPRRLSLWIEQKNRVTC